MLTADLKPVYAYSIVLGLLVGVYLFINFADIERVFAFTIRARTALFRSVEHVFAPSSRIPEEAAWQAENPSPYAEVYSKEDISDGDVNGTTPSLADGTNKDEDYARLLPGVWIGSALMRDNRAKKDVEFNINNILYPDGKFESITLISDGKILRYSGNWRVSDGNMIWETLDSNQPSFRVPHTENNKIIELDGQILVLQEKGFQSKWIKK
jgi:hypothetical protein